MPPLPFNEGQMNEGQMNEDWSIFRMPVLSTASPPLNANQKLSANQKFNAHQNLNTREQSDACLNPQNNVAAYAFSSCPRSQITVATLPRFPFVLPRNQQVLAVKYPLMRRQRGPISMTQRYERANLVLEAAAACSLTIEEACRSAGIDVRERGRILRQLIADAKVRPLPPEEKLDIIDPLPYDLDLVRRGLVWKAVKDLSIGDHIVFPKASDLSTETYTELDISTYLAGDQYTVLDTEVYYGRGRRQFAEAFDYLSRYHIRIVDRGKGFKDGERKHLLEEKGWSVRDFEDAQEQIRRPGADRRWFPRYITVDEEFAAFCGYFVAEGHTDGKAVYWNFHKDEVAYWTEIGNVLQRLIGKPGKLYRRPGNGVIYSVGCCPLAQILPTIFGCGAHAKHFPAWWSSQPKSVLISFLRALFNGDGHMIESGSRLVIGLTTVSEKLACQVRLLLSSLGIVSSITNKKPHTTYLKTGQRIRSGPAFVVNIQGDQALLLADMFGYRHHQHPKNQQTLWFQDDKYLYLRVNAIEPMPVGNGEKN